MKRTYLCLLAAASLGVASLTGCTTMPGADQPGTSVGVPDELVTAKKGLGAVWAAFDLALTGVEELLDAGQLPKGSAKAKKVAGYIRTATAALTAAGDAVTMAEFIAQTTKAGGVLKDMATALKGN